MRGRDFLAFVAAAALVAALHSPAHAEAADPALQARIDAVKANSKDPLGHFNLGVEYYNRRMLDLSSASFQTALKTDRKNKDAHEQIDIDCYRILGQISLARKENGEAVKWFDQGLKMVPGDAVCLFGRGQAFFQDRKIAAAQEAFNRFLRETEPLVKQEQPPDKKNLVAQVKGMTPQALNYLGAMALDLKRYDEAAGYFRRVVREYPKEATEIKAEYNLALVLLAEGDELMRSKQYGLATTSYDEAVLMNPKDNGALRSTARAHYGYATDIKKMEARKAEAIAHFGVAEKHFLSAVKIDPKDFESSFYAGLSEYELDKFADMITSYERTVNINPGHAEARYNLSLALQRANRFEEALKQADEAKKINPEDKSIDLLRSSIYEKWEKDEFDKGTDMFTQDRIPEAIAHWETVTKINPANPDAAPYIERAKARQVELVKEKLELGDKAFDKGDLATANEAWTQVLQNDPNNQAAKDKLKQVGPAQQRKTRYNQGANAYNTGDYQKAINIGNALLALNAKDAKAAELVRRARLKQASGIKAILANGVKALKKGNYKLAASELDRAAASDPNNKDVANFRLKLNTTKDRERDTRLAEGADAIRANNKAVAQKAFNRVLEIDPNNEQANKSIKSLTGKESVVKVSAEKVKSLYKKGINAYLANKLEDAEQAWAEANKLDPQNGEIKRYLDRVRLKLGKSS